MLKALDRWLPAYLADAPHRRPVRLTDVMLCVCDHFEPLHGTDLAGAGARLAEWKKGWPALAEKFRDDDGVFPRHTFFYPIEQYQPVILEELARLCARAGTEVEVHLHHDQDTADGLGEKLEQGVRDLSRHGLLARDAEGRLRFGFIHGDWALDNSHPEGRHCGVTNELAVLRAAGCYADFTMPSMPSPTQARLINRLYYAAGTEKPRSFDRGDRVRVGSAPANPPRPRPGELLMVQGPLGFNWGWRKWGMLPRLENGDLTGRNPPTPLRFRVWEKMHTHVEGRPEWLFIKLHTHGGIPRNYEMLLGEPMRQFYHWLEGDYRRQTACRLHYVTARELVNILHAAEDGLTGNPGGYRDYRYRRQT